jgi:5'-nucleotidase (lipoprotein e(P4) family)
MMNRSLLAALSLSLAACASVPTTPPAATPAVQTSAAARPSADLLQSVLYVQTAAEYEAAAIGAFNTAKTRLDAAIADPKRTAATEQTGDVSHLLMAVILDADETVVDNSAYQARLIRDGRMFDDPSWTAWVNEARARAVPGARDFLDYAQSRGVEICYVTNRKNTEEEATRRNFASLGFPLNATYDTLLVRGENEWTTGDKSPRRAHVAKTHRILLLIGDDLGDFITIDRKTRDERRAIIDANRERWGRDWIMVPNPMYGSWERALTTEAQTDADRFRMRNEALRVD